MYQKWIKENMQDIVLLLCFVALDNSLRCFIKKYGLKVQNLGVTLDDIAFNGRYFPFV